MRVRRVRYASAGARDPRLPGHDGRPRSGRPAAGGRSPDSGARFAARPATRSPPGADLVHAHWWVPAGLAAPPERSAGAHRPRHRRGAASRAPGWRAALARPVFERARGRHRGLPRARRAGCRPPTGRHIAPAHVHPMPVDTERLALDHRRRRRGRRRPPHRRRSGSTWRSRPPPSSRRAGTTSRSPSSATAPSARRSSVRSSGSASRRSSASPAPSRRPR